MHYFPDFDLHHPLSQNSSILFLHSWDIVYVVISIFISKNIRIGTGLQTIDLMYRQAVCLY